ncbi:MAG: molybdopterin-synthase adenylyltransferase MoeB [Helicobacteraceae bacterium]|nr:molybdopterin-synthase adenylyltransferase MoeB [Helicobacteraceae bacterium]
MDRSVVKASAALDDVDIARYSRHLILSEVGVEGQEKIKAAKVLIVGTGGLGAPLALYLAAAGVGTIALADFDVVEESNLQRQVIYSTGDIGKPKVAAAKDRITGINPRCNVVAYDERLTSKNALEIFQGYDVVADGADNFQTRYLVNDACVLLGIPNVYGSILRFDGQAAVFYAKEGPCYRCLYPVPPPPGLVPSCAEGGVIGVLPGIVGSIQAGEVIKLILGASGSLIGRLLLFDQWRMRFREVKIDKDPACPICGENRTIHHLIDYDQFCGVGSRERSVEEITPLELKARLDAGSPLQLIDVREDYERRISTMPGAKAIPLWQIAQRKSEIDPAIGAVLICRVGERSKAAIDALKNAGFKGQLINLKGGINAWASEVDASLPIY